MPERPLQTDPPAGDLGSDQSTKSLQPTPKVVLVTGGRTYNNWMRAYFELDGLKPVAKLIHGAAKGADTIAEKWAETNKIPFRRHYAEWDKYGKAAGNIRNQQMLDLNPDINVVLAFPGGRGTADMVARATAKGLLVIKVDSET